MGMQSFLVLIFVSIVVSSLAEDLTCNQLYTGSHTNDDDKRKAQLCQLTELAGVLSDMTSTLREAMIAVLNEQGKIKHQTFLIYLYLVYCPNFLFGSL